MFRCPGSANGWDTSVGQEAIRAASNSVMAGGKGPAWAARGLASGVGVKVPLPRVWRRCGSRCPIVVSNCARSRPVADGAVRRAAATPSRQAVAASDLREG
jgi:hypothetical protein